MKKEFEVEISSETLSSGINQFLSEKQKTAKIIGFRPGKVPETIIRKNYGFEALRDSLEKAVQKNVNKLIDDNKFDLATSPYYEILEAPSDLDELSVKKTKIKIIFELSPEIPEIDFAKIKITKYVPEVSDKDVDAALKKAADDHTHSEPLDKPRPAEVGDTLVYSLEYKAQGQDAQNLSGAFVLGKSMFPKEFEDELVGIEKGHAITDNLKLPKNMRLPGADSKKVSFKVEFTDIRKTIPHKVDDVLAKAMGFDTLALYREEIKKRIEAELSQKAGSLATHQMNEQIEKNLTFDVPESSVNGIVNNTLRRRAAEMGNIKTQEEFEAKIKEITGKDFSKFKDELMDNARKYLRKRTFFLDIAKKNNIQYTDDELMTAASMSMRNAPVQQVISFYRGNPSRLDSLRAALLEAKASALAFSKCETKEEKITSEKFNQLFDKISQGEQISVLDESAEGDIENIVEATSETEKG